MKKIMRIISALVMCITLILTCMPFSYVRAQGQNYADFWVSASEIVDGKFTVTVLADFAACTSVNGIDLFLYYYAPDFIFDSFTKGQDFMSSSIKYDVPGTVKMLWDTAMNYTAGTVTLFSVNFTVSENASEGNHEFNLLCYELYDADINDIPNACYDCSVWIGKKLELSHKQLNISVGEKIDVTANKGGIIWNSFNQGIASVDENGKITAVFPGKTYVSASCGNENQVVTVTVKNEAFIITSDVYKTDDKFLSNIKAGTTVSELISNIIGGTNISAFNENGEAITNGLIKTGMTISVMKNGAATGSLTAVADGDINSDGYFDVKDLIRLKKVLAGLFESSEAQTFAAAGKDAPFLSSADLSRIRIMLL